MRHKRDLFWRLRLLGPREIAGILFVVGLAAVIITVMMLPYRSPNFGFGPDWACTSAGQGDPVCVKKTDPAPN
jgi:hypothetical protein